MEHLQAANGNGLLRRSGEGCSLQSSPQKSEDSDNQLSLQLEDSCGIEDAHNNNSFNGGMGDSQSEEKPEMSAEELQEIAKKKRSYVLMELLETEKDYVDDLSKIVNGYMETLKIMELPDDLIGKDKIVFGNIHQIYDFHRETFLPEVEKLVTDAQGLGLLFTKHEKRLSMYVKYCGNKPKSEFIVAEYLHTVFNEVKGILNHRLQLTDLLIKPVQRIMKYQLLLKDILKYTRRSGESCDSLEDAIVIMQKVPKEANDMMNVSRLQGFDGKLTAQGKLLLQDTLPVAEHNPSKSELKFKERRIFVFEQILIFSEVVGCKNSLSPPYYIFKHAIKVNKMSLEDEVAENSLLFKLTDKTPSSGLSVFIQTSNHEQKQQWTSKIRHMLDLQGNFLLAIQSPIAFQKGGHGYDTLDGRMLRQPKARNETAGSGCSATLSSHPVQRKSSIFDSLKKGKHKSVASADSKPVKLPFVRVLSKYSADGDSEVSCSRGDLVQLLDVDYPNNRFLVFKPQSPSSPGVEGWMPGLPLGVIGPGQDSLETGLATSTHYLSAGDEERSDRKMRLKLIRRRSKSPHSRPVNSWQQKLSFKITALSNSMMEPSFNFEPDSVTVKVGEEATLECHISGKPKPNVFWKTPDGRISLPDGHLEWTESDYGHYSCTLKHALLSDSGTYTCLAVSEMGEVERSALVEVIDLADPPGRPTLSVQDGESALISWDSPRFDGHSPVEGYTVEHSHTGASEWAELVSFVKNSNTHVVELDKLENGQTHFFRVRAYNGAGLSEPSLVSNPLPRLSTNTKAENDATRTDWSWKFHFEDLHKLESAVCSFSGGEMRLYKHMLTELPVWTRCINSADSAHAERGMLVKCKHPNILQPLEYYKSDSMHFFILPDVRQPLLERVCENAEVCEVDFVIYSRQLIKAVQGLQDRNILHLNILPETVLVTQDRVVKLTGFEKAILQADESKPTNVYNEELQFQPVEWASDEEISPATDIWSVGVFIYLMLCGQTPFYDEDPSVVKENLLHINLQFADELFPHVSDGCLTLLKVMFIRNPRMRPLADRCLQCSWLNVLPDENSKLCTHRLSRYLDQRKQTATSIINSSPS